MTLFDRYQYDESTYAPEHDPDVQAASVDHNKIVRLLALPIDLLRLTCTLK